MTLDEYKLYQQNFNFFREKLEAGEELILLPTKVKDMKGPSGEFAERVAICTKNAEGQVFPHALMIWANPNDLLLPLLIENVDSDKEPSRIII